MIDNNLIQAAIVAKTQSLASLTAQLPEGTNGIREYNWKGTDFQYPCVRIHLENQTDLINDAESCPAQIEWSFYILSEQSSSKQANQIAGIIVSQLRGLSFSQNNIKFVRIKILENIPAMAVDERVWSAQIRCRSIIHTG